MDLSPERIAAARAELGIPPERYPRHVAIIMDGNGRWAHQRGWPRPMGHTEGAKVVRTIVTESARLGLEALTLYAFSAENWRRPQEEINALMSLYVEYLRAERPMIMSHNIRFRHLGRRTGLPQGVLDELDGTVRATSIHKGMWLNLAINYGSRDEILNGVRALARRVAAGTLAPEAIDEDALSGVLDTAGIVDPDLVIRTAGEMRISNFLLWQISYAEFYATPVMWPDFREKDLHEALRAFAARNRRFGGLDKP